MSAPTPPVTASLLARFRASEITGKADGDRVTTWSDLTGGGRDLTSAGGPVFRTAGINGIQALEFAAVGTEKLAAGFAWLPKPHSVYAVVRPDSVAVTTWWASFTGYTNENLIGFGGSSRPQPFYDNAARGTIAGDTSATVMAVTADGTNIMNFWRNDTSGQGRQGYYAAAPMAGVGPGLLRVGGKSIAGNEWDGMLAEVLVYSAMHGPSDVALITGWLAKQYLIGPYAEQEFGGLASSGSGLPSNGRMYPRT